MKETRSLLGKSDTTKSEMRKLVMQTSETASTREDTEQMVKTTDITYVKDDLKQVANNATNPNTEEITLLLSLLEEFEDLFDGTLGYWYTEPVHLELKADPKTFTSRYYTVPRTSKDFFSKGA